MKRSMLIASCFTTLLISGCTGTEVTVSPDPGTQPAVKTGSYNSIGLRDVQGDKIYPPAGNLTEGFANELRASGFARNIYYPLRPDDKVDLTVDSKFNTTMDAHMGASMGKAFLTGLTLFLLEPLFWYDYDYTLTGQLTVTGPNNQARTVSATTDANMSMKWLSLSNAQALEGEALAKGKKSLYNQLMHDLEK